MIMETTVNTDLVIFDLDGTLLDTIGDLAVACNAVLALRGLPQHSYEEYCHFVGNGIMRLVERALPDALRTPSHTFRIFAVANQATSAQVRTIQQAPHQRGCRHGKPPRVQAFG